MRNKHTLILWNEDSQKWQDQGNDYFCSRSFNGQTWQVRARYSFPDGTAIKDFPNEQEAMEFFVNFLYSRVMGFIDEAHEKR